MFALVEKFEIADSLTNFARFDYSNANKINIPSGFAGIRQKLKFLTRLTVRFGIKE